MALSLPVSSDAWVLYTKPSFKGKVIDTETKRPIEGVVAVAVYEKVVYGIVQAGSEVIHVNEALTDSEGVFRIPEYATLINPIGWNGDARIIILKPGYGNYHVYKGMRLNLYGPGEKYFSEHAFGKHKRMEFTVVNDNGVFDSRTFDVPFQAPYWTRSLLDAPPVSPIRLPVSVDNAQSGLAKSGAGVIGPIRGAEPSAPTVRPNFPVESLRTIVADPNHHYLDRAEAAYLLGLKSRNARDAELLARTLYDLEPVCGKAQKGLERMGNVAVESLIRVLRDTIPPGSEKAHRVYYARLLAARTMEAIRDSRIMEELIRFLPSDGRDSHIARSLARGLGNYQSARAAEALAATVIAERRGARRDEAYRSLIRIGPAAVQSLIPMVKHKEEELRIEAIYCLMVIGDRESVPALIPALRDPATAVRRAARYALAALGDPRAVPPQLEAWRSDDADTRFEATVGVTLIGSPAVQSLTAMLRDKDPRIRWRAAWCLGWIGDPAAAGPLATLRHDENFEVRWLSAEALFRIGKGKVEEGLLGFCADHDKGIRNLANASLMKLGEKGCTK